MPCGTHSLQGLRCSCGEVCAKSCQTGYSFQKSRMGLQALCTSDDHTPRGLLKPWHAESCKQHNTLLCILQSIWLAMAIHILMNDYLDSSNFSRGWSKSSIEDKNRVVQVGALAVMGNLCWIHHFSLKMTQSLSPGLDNGNLECWPSSCGPSLNFSLFLESCLLCSSSCILAESWVIPESFPFSLPL